MGKKNKKIKEVKREVVINRKEKLILKLGLSND